MVGTIFFSRDHLRSIFLLHDQDVDGTDIDVMDTSSSHEKKKKREKKRYQLLLLGDIRDGYMMYIT